MHVYDKKLRLNFIDIVRVQIFFHCFINKISLSDNEIDCLAILSSFSECNLSLFCEKVVEYNVFKSPQTVRNFIVKAVSNGLIDRNGSIIKISQKMNIKRDDNMLLKYELLYVAKK